ncbi:MAG: hypothetical protein Q8N00_05405 [Nitrospirota bacterium]|nr:hypothetical protein [Nitrospirota bacterium]MDP3596451.1 hypothetical protein [Nitrospirota bacterium]
MTMRAQSLRPTRSSGIVLLWGSLVWLSGCSTSPVPPPNPDAVRQHADKAFQQLHAQEQPLVHTETSSPPQSSATADQPSGQASTKKAYVQVPLAEIQQSDDGYVRATGYGNLSKGLSLCQHSADLAARVELSKLIRVKVTERSTDRIRERTGKEAEQDIEIVREGLVNEVLSEVRIMDRNVDKDAAICSSTAVIPKKNLTSLPVSGSTANVKPQ